MYYPELLKMTLRFYYKRNITSRIKYCIWLKDLETASQYKYKLLLSVQSRHDYDLPDFTSYEVSTT